VDGVEDFVPKPFFVRDLVRARRWWWTGYASNACAAAERDPRDPRPLEELGIAT